MPNTKSAKKRNRQGMERRSKNRAVKSTLKTAIKKFREAVATKQFDEAKTMLSAMSKSLDQAASKRVIHVNKAARTKSRLHQLIVKASGAEAAAVTA
ncbi:MAG: 30S ribosomal protein S20 [Pirellulaceae bacterium]|nr:30S ribosomal protein S20 [Pirellulaceae bacterium]